MIATEKSLTARIIELREAEPRLTQREMARKLGCTQAAVSYTLKAVEELKKEES